MLASSLINPKTNWHPRRDVQQIVAGVFDRVRAHEKELQPLV